MALVFGWLLNGLYLLLVAALTPLVVYRRITKGKYRRGWREKLTGKLTRRDPDRPCFWFHAVSVGEVVQLQKVVEETSARFPTHEIFISVTTETGYDVAKEKYSQHTIAFFPLDFTWAVEAALAAVRPSLIVLVELELWPNFILRAHRRRIPLVLINGRIGEKSFRGYSRIRPLMRWLLSRFDLLAVQSQTFGERLQALGAAPKQVVVTGNIKFDRAESNSDNPKTNELRTAFGIHPTDVVFIAGSTQDPEEAYAIDVWLTLKRDFPQLRLIVVPRHKERFEEVANLIRSKGCSLLRRSQAGGSSSHATTDESATSPVILLDTLGELAACWGLARIAFVGGSLTNRGGQNMLEPAGFGAAVLFGPNTWNFQDITDALLTQQAALVIRDAAELRGAVRDLLEHPQKAADLGQRARQFVSTQRGATRRTIDLITEVLNHQRN